MIRQRCPEQTSPTQPGSIQTQRGEVLYSRTDPAIQTMLNPQCEQEVANCERRAEGYCKNSDDQCWMRFGSSDLRPWRGGTVGLSTLLPWKSRKVDRIHAPRVHGPFVVLGEVHLRRFLKSYARYYNAAKTHRSLNKDSTISRPVHRTGRSISHPILGGLHQQYSRI